VNRAFDEAAEIGSRRCPIKTVIVVKDSNPHWGRTAENLSACLKGSEIATS
jgi:hypothetical protein